MQVRKPLSGEDAGRSQADAVPEAVTELDQLEVSSRFDPETGRRTKKAVLVVALILILSFVAVLIERSVKSRSVANSGREATAAPRTVDVIVAKPVGSVQQFVLPGQTAAWHASTIYGRVNGYVGNWTADIGDHVKRGQVLALIETPELDAQLSAARAQLKAAQAQVSVRSAETALAKTTYERWRDSPKGVVSEQEREEKKADYDSALARMKSAEADVALDRARVNQYTAMSAFKQVTAPFDGVVTERAIDIGNLVTAGSTSATTPLYVITQDDPIRIFVDVPQSAAADLVRGRLPVQIQTSGGDRHDLTGSVTRSAQSINTRARTMRIEVDVPNKDQSFVPGMYVKVAFGLQPKGLVQVPAAALVFRSSGPQVAQVDRSGRIHFRAVTIARDDGDVVELDSGVKPGDRLALNVSSQIGDGDAVQANVLDSGAGHGSVSTAQRQ